MTILIWQKRNERGMSLRDLAKATGISKSTLQRLETARDLKYSPSLLQLKKIAIALNCRITDLFDDDMK